MIQNVVSVLALDIPTKAKFLAVCLADASDEFGVCFPSMTTLSQQTCMPERTLQRCLQWLIDHGVVTTFWEFTDRIKNRKIRHYRLNLESTAKRVRPDYSNCTPELRQEVIVRFRFCCSYCNESGDEEHGPDGKSWHVDRIVPGSRGGKYIASNVTLSCATCNIRKGAKMAPSVKSLGAILNEQGCHSSVLMVPPMAPEPPVEPLLEPSDDTFTLIPPQTKRSGKPSIEEVRAYCDERHNSVSAEKFVSYYQSNGWKVGRSSMKDWRAAVRTWELNSNGGKGNGTVRESATELRRRKNQEAVEQYLAQGATGNG